MARQRRRSQGKLGPPHLPRLPPRVSDRPLEGFGAVVVGGSRGIGSAVSALLAECGAGVVVNGRDEVAAEATVAAITRAGGRAVAHAGSAADETIAEELITLCENEFGAVDALVNCAGAPEPPGSSILSVTPAEFRDLLDIHLGTTFATCRAAAPSMVARGRGAIVNTSSFAFLGDYGGTGYPAGKGAVNGLTMAIAAELAEHGVRANVVCPRRQDPVIHRGRLRGTDRVAAAARHPRRPQRTGCAGCRCTGVRRPAVRLPGQRPCPHDHRADLHRRRRFHRSVRQALPRVHQLPGSPRLAAVERR